MNWQEIYKKYKDSELMDKFNMYVYDNEGESIGDSTSNIKDIWGYLIVFAETKGWELSITTYDFGESKPKGFVSVVAYQADDYTRARATLEQAMLWCADKFFEVAIKEDEVPDLTIWHEKE